MTDLLLDIDAVLATQELWMVGNWTNAARYTFALLIFHTAATE